MPLRLEFLYLGALIAVAAALQGNVLSACLAVAALLLLLFVRIEFSPLSRPPHFVRGREEGANKGRASRSLVYHGDERMNEDNYSVTTIAQNAHDNCAEVTVMAVEEARRMASKAIGPEDAAYISGSASLGCLTSIALLVAKSVDVDVRRLTDSDKMRLMRAAVNRETLTFAALMAACMQTTVNVDSGDSATEFGPHVLWDALKAWECVYPDKRAEDYLNSSMVAAARRFGDAGQLPQHIIDGRRRVSGGHLH